ncbi:hypothetical protein ACFO0U_13530 [Chromohalobacter sarecensis]|uniref:DUF2254 domain-containing protein n=1 Tax=Chromohalobacter sarecensis TaxID=245294 RepID=A0ABV9D4U8_9GAMM|nr:hypothetical protein [Chromohalobacter sarecensis]MCK0714443.1 hypothetical protein [Chromohalobacter sarecensis]
MLTHLRWFLSLGAKFGRVVPLYSLVIVLFTLSSQVSALLASLLPLKVVILLGSDGIPSYFPASFADINRDILIGSLSAATLGFFLLYLLFERFINLATARATKHLLLKSQKIVLFDNQDETAANAYQRYSRALAGAVFVLLALGGLAPFYPSMVSLMVGYSLLSLMLTVLLYNRSWIFREKLESSLSPVLKLISGVGFFVFFGFLVVDFMFWSPPSFLVAVVSLIASRQITQRVTGSIGDLAALQKQRLKLDALFFHGKVLLPDNLRAEKTMWPMLSIDKREKWVCAVLSEVLEKDIEKVEIFWHQIGVPNVAGLEARTEGGAYLIKLFETNRSALALHESTLMAEPLQGLPSLPWVGATQLGKLHCLVYSLPQGNIPEPSMIKQFLEPLKTQILSVEPPKALVARFKRSRPMLWQRLDSMPWDRLQVAANTVELRHQISSLLEQLPVLQQELKELPVTFVIPKIQADLLWMTEDGDALIKNWGRWTIEPVGCGWLDKLQMLPLLAPALAEAAEQRSSLNKVIPEKAELAALTFALEQECSRQRYVQALEVLPLLLERLQSCKEKQDKMDFMK